ncbi:response regulator [Chroococcidiopsis sp.]|uniref:response regulator n=1 Tax=Chroococcidiopsis sp. TaxID=3088168 RepID=UPI003F2EACA7
MKILLVEDDEGTAEILRTTLIEQHYLVELAMDGRIGLEMAGAFTYDLILLDIMLPKLDGLDFCRQLRDRKDCTPVLLLTALDSNTSKIMGLEAGADDYVVKPFDPYELLARIRALLRRGSSALSSVIEAGKIALDSNSCRVTCDGQLLHLTAKEYALLELLLRNSHRIFSQQALLEHLWSYEEIPSENTLRTHIKALRRKLKQAGADAIETVYGLGYRLKLGEDEVKSQATATTHSPSAAIAPVTTVKQQIAPARVAIWERYKHKYSDRIATLEQAIATLEQGKLTPELGQQARAEAHLLIGSLASFSKTKASQICRQIEQIFRAGVESSLEARHLTQLVVALRQELELPAATKELAERSLATVKQQRRLLIVDNDSQLGEQLISEATIWGIQAELVTDLTAARKAIAQNCPDVVLLDLCFDRSVENGLNLLTELKTNHRHLPVLVLAAQDNFANRIEVARLGGRIFLSKPVFPVSVLTAIDRVLSQSDIVAAKILVVDDDPQTLDILRTVLEPWGFKLALVDNPRHFWDKLERYNPDLLILDVEMPELSGIDLCQVVRSDPQWCELPVLFLSVHTDAATVDRVFAAGADDYINKPILGAQLIARVLNRLERTQTLHKLADTDLLTGIANRRKAIQELNQLLRLAKRQSQPLCFIILDLDRFKLVNDRHGHEVGDRVLRQFGALLQQTFRGEDAIARWGGEEFVVGLYDATRQQAMARLTELQEIVHQQEFTGASGEKFRVSFSGGIAEYPEDGADLPALYRSADAALYVAKAGGRGQVSSWS